MQTEIRICNVLPWMPATGTGRNRKIWMWGHDPPLLEELWDVIVGNTAVRKADLVVRIRKGGPRCNYAVVTLPGKRKFLHTQLEKQIEVIEKPKRLYFWDLWRRARRQAAFCRLEWKPIKQLMPKKGFWVSIVDSGWDYFLSFQKWGWEYLNPADCGIRVWQITGRNYVSGTDYAKERKVMRHSTPGEETEAGACLFPLGNFYMDMERPVLGIAAEWRASGEWSERCVWKWSSGGRMGNHGKFISG